MQVTFPSSQHFKECIKPYNAQEIATFLKKEHQIEIGFDSQIEIEKPTLVRNPAHHLFFKELFQDDSFTVYYPENPRIDHHLVIQINKSTDEVIGFEPQLQVKLHHLIQKIQEIYVQQLGLTGFVIAQYTQAAARHEGKEVIEILPNHPLYGHCRNFLDKVDSNRYVLFGDDNLTPVHYELSQAQRDEQIAFWQEQLKLDQRPLSAHQVTQELPVVMTDAFFEKINEYIIHNLLEYFQNSGAKIPDLADKTFVVPQDLSNVEYTTREISKCVFCNQNIIQNQLVYEHEGMQLLYNFRKMPYEGTSFLIIPKRHLERTYGLTDEEVQAAAILKQALIHVLQAKYPDFEVAFYVQEGMSAGQTVLHAPEQIVALDPKHTVMHWTMLSFSVDPIHPTGMTKEEMAKVTSEFHDLIGQEISKFTIEQTDSASA